jgi:hypothetical protein
MASPIALALKSCTAPDLNKPPGTRLAPTLDPRRPRNRLGRVLINQQPMLTWMCRPTSVIGGKADMVRTCQYVR